MYHPDDDRPERGGRTAGGVKSSLPRADITLVVPLPHAAWVAIALVAAACVIGVLRVVAESCAAAKRRHDLMIRVRLMRAEQERLLAD